MRASGSKQQRTWQVPRSYYLSYWACEDSWKQLETVPTTLHNVFCILARCYARWGQAIADRQIGGNSCETLPALMRRFSNLVIELVEGACYTL